MTGKVLQRPGQSIYDLCLQTYGTLDLLVKFCIDNNITNLGDIPQQVEYVYDTTLVKFEGNTNIYVTDVMEPPFNSTTQFSPVYDVNVGSPLSVHMISIDDTHPAGIANTVKRFTFALYDPNMYGPDLEMTIRVGGLDELRVNFSGQYLGKAFAYTDSLGQVQNGTFKIGYIDF